MLLSFFLLLHLLFLHFTTVIAKPKCLVLNILQIHGIKVSSIRNLNKQLYKAY